MHADTLKHNFQQSSPMHTEYHGVIIGLGDGWYNMKNPGPRPYVISSSCPHLYLLRISHSRDHSWKPLHRGHKTLFLFSHTTFSFSSTISSSTRELLVLQGIGPMYIHSTLFFFLYQSTLSSATNNLPHAILLNNSCLDNTRREKSFQTHTTMFASVMPK